MAKFVWLLLGLVVVTQGLSVEKAKAEIKKAGKNVTIVDPKPEAKLSWPTQYTLKAIRMSLIDNVVENYEIWRTSGQSRIDYNNGHVKSIVNTVDKQFPYGVQYEIHPEADKDQEVTSVCSNNKGSSSRWKRFVPETILPNLHGYEAVAEEVMNDKECTKFEFVYQDGISDIKHTLWATYIEEDKAWVPVKYEVLDFQQSRNWHEIWDFYDYEKAFSFLSVFNVSDYNCPTEATTHTFDSEGVTKHLLFIDADNDDHVDHVFKTFKKTHNRKYSDAIEHKIRKSVFKRSMRQIIQTNRQNKGYKLAINQFADKTSEEMNSYMGLMKRPEGKVGTTPFPYDEERLKKIANEIPVEYDARLSGLVSIVKNQGRCGSCWAFGATAAAEGALARKNGGIMTTLSEQAVVDCAWAFDNGGCKGGTDTGAYDWMMKYGLPTEAEYGPYTSKNGACNIKNMTRIFPIRDYVDVTPFNVGALKVALFNHGPLSVSVYVSKSFRLYSSGIFYDTNCNQTRLNHEVTLVGYGEYHGDTFWILKNSWGRQWGIGGYMYISARDNTCGVTTEPTYVVF